MTRDDHRAKCIEAMEAGYYKTWQFPSWPGEVSVRDMLIAAFDALHHIARVVSPEATEEMNKEFYREYANRAPNEMIFHILKVGDLTNPPETKP